MTISFIRNLPEDIYKIQMDNEVWRLTKKNAIKLFTILMEFDDKDIGEKK